MPSRLRIDRWIALVCLGLTAAGAGAATFTVTTTADSGAGSLRQAIVDANELVPVTCTRNSGPADWKSIR